ncbi:NADH dehydrogenase [ubiquinone] 1 alpha subcomplex assembly factor 2 isoform X3 [Cyclopterus lumpus]|uniref:NADH dehydrogenase [ubiquinone] 1 alpha subcomplex assembly factor 2 isoform X3 n=1 Tax=Cyclopterus lumpus TaxID=8103 RepID=UPI001486AA00|nr:NADH dehydrogenase [ubiquinone] 1 alpha subcomplex assembly factor 2 isoform X3 [Cyclopterus lumpus]
MAVCHQSVDSSRIFPWKESQRRETRVQMAVHPATSHPQGVMKEGLSHRRTPSRCSRWNGDVQSRHSRLLRARRMVEPANPTEYEYAEGNIPMEWDAWIRGRRKEPPSAKELLKNETYRENIKLKAREVEEKDLTLQAQEYEEGLVATSAKTVAKGHASITSFGKQEVSEDPTSTANAFQPGSWMPKK